MLFWSHLVVLLLMSVGLGRIRALPLKTWQWFLLSLGFAPLPTVVMLTVVAFFCALQWRGRVDASSMPAWRFNLTQVVLGGLTVGFLLALYSAVHSNLLLDVDMQVTGAGSSNDVLQWYVDRVDGALPTPALLSVPIIVWRLAMLLWSLWLVSALMKWVKWAWLSFQAGGAWRAISILEPKPKTPTGEMVPLPPHLRAGEDEAGEQSDDDSGEETP